MTTGLDSNLDWLKFDFASLIAAYLLVSRHCSLATFVALLCFVAETNSIVEPHSVMGFVVSLVVAVVVVVVVVVESVVSVQFAVLVVDDD